MTRRLRNLRMRSIWLAVLASACADATTDDRPMPRSAVATCTTGIYGGGSSTEVHSNGEIRVRTFEPNRLVSDSLIGRDSARVAGLLDRLNRLPWEALRGDSGLRDVQCGVQVKWDDTTRTVSWFPAGEAGGLAELRRLHAEIHTLGNVRREPASAPVIDTARKLTARENLGDRLETGCIGGVTGGGQGAVVTRDGRVLTWQQPRHAPTERELSFLRRDSALVARFFETAEREGLARTTFAEPSNVTCFLTLVTGGRMNEVAWPMGATPPRIRKLVELANEINTAAGRR